MEKCIVCNKKSLTRVIELGLHPPADSFVVDCHSTMTIGENAFLVTPNLSEIELPAGATCNNCGVTTTAWSQGACGPTQSPTAAPTHASDSKEDSDSNYIVIIIIIVVAVVIISALGYTYLRYIHASDTKIKVVELIANNDDEI